MYSRLLKIPENKSFFLFGPRGTGKTTWVKSNFPSAIYIDLLEATNYNNLMANPQRIENFIPPNFKDWVIVDEVQRVPDILNEVHRLIETYRYKFILTGSSARKLKRKGPNLLAGRALTLSMHPLTVQELGKDFQINNSLLYGQLPSIYVEKAPKKYLESYVKTYLQEEILAEGLARNLAAFYRFLEAASFSQGSVLNVSEIAREVGIVRKVVENYFTILEDLLIAYRIPVFSKRTKRRLVTHSKFYFFDTGVYRTIRPMGPLDIPQEVEGIAFETLLFQELMAINDYFDLGYQIFYWRTAHGAEVDFVLYGPRGIKAFEVKRTGRISSSMLGGLKSFLKDYPQTKAYFVYGGNKRQYIGNIEVVPLVETLTQLKNILTSNS
jgi:predicted AAA+ superfamily ATPase